MTERYHDQPKYCPLHLTGSECSIVSFLLTNTLNEWVFDDVTRHNLTELRDYIDTESNHYFRKDEEPKGNTNILQDDKNV